MTAGHDPKVIIEAAVIPGRELECGGAIPWIYSTDGSRPAPSARSGWRACVAARMRSTTSLTKYLEDAAELDVPARLDPIVADEVRQLAIRAFDAIDCQGLARVDF